MGLLDQYYLDAIKGFEGFSPQATWDYKQNSNGYGTKAQYPGETIDQGTADQRFRDEVGKAQGVVEGVAPDAPEGVKAALTSLTYNTGSKWVNSGLGEAVRAGDWDKAQTIFQQYNKAGGQVLPGLVDRRAQEAAWFNRAPTLAPPTDVAALPSPAQPAGPPLPLEPQKPLPPQPLNMGQAQQPQMAAYPWSPQQQPQEDDFQLNQLAAKPDPRRIAMLRMAMANPTIRGFSFRG